MTHPRLLRRILLSTLGIRDTSGIRLYYTSHLRKYDMGVLELGISVFPIHFIPPGAEAFLSYGLCKTEKFEEVKLRDRHTLGFLVLHQSSGLIPKLF